MRGLAPLSTPLCKWGERPADSLTTFPPGSGSGSTLLLNQREPRAPASVLNSVPPALPRGADHLAAPRRASPLAMPRWPGSPPHRAASSRSGHIPPVTDPRLLRTLLATPAFPRASVMPAPPSTGRWLFGGVRFLQKQSLSDSYCFYRRKAGNNPFGLNFGWCVCWACWPTRHPALGFPVSLMPKRQIKPRHDLQGFHQKWAP